MHFRCFDIEGTGLPEEGPIGLVEIGACDVDVLPGGKIIVGRPEAVLCNPGMPIPPMATAVHHITDGMVEGATGDLSFLGSADHYVAHFADYERHFYKEHPIICTWRVALRLWPDEPSHGLQYLRYRLDLPAHEIWSMPPHRGGPDAYVCALLLAHIIHEGRCTVEEMVRWSSGPGLLTRVTFGKHKGSRWEELPSDYLCWIIDKSDMDHNVKANAAYRLKQRGEL